MRPLNIKISAFGPYAGHTEIPMDELGEQGLYLITGDTGAGKSTIFDAICFALYGEASGPSRDDVAMFRSKYADPDTPTEVELTFSHAGKEYVVKRNPEYMRPAKRGGGLTKQMADATLSMPDGSVVTKVKTVTSKIEEILGINKDQFTQISMLAQGDFLKLLLATTTDRMQIFRELFKTKNYLTLQRNLEAGQKELYGTLMDGRKSIDQYISGISVDRDDVLSLDVEKAKSGELTLEDVIALLDKLTDQDSLQKDKLDAELERINKELEKVNGKIAVSKELDRAKKSLEENKEKLSVEEPKVEELLAAFDTAKSKLDDKKKLEGEATRIETELPEYDAVDKLTRNIEETEGNLEILKKSLVKNEKARDSKQSELDELKKEQASYEDTSARIEKLKAQLERIETEAEEIDDLSASLKKYFDSVYELEKSQEGYQKDNEKFQRLNALYESMDQAFRDGQAGILAKDLQDGNPCPVCGSKSHPVLAHLSDEVPTEKELEKAKKDADKARSVRDKSAEEISGQRKVIGATETDLKKKSRKLLKTDDLYRVRDDLEDVIDGIIAKREEAQASLEAERDKVEKKKRLDDKIPKLDTKIKEIGQTIENTRVDISASETKLKSDKKQLEDKLKKLSFDSKSAAKKQSRALTKQAEAIQKAYDDADKALKDQDKLVSEIKAEIKANEKTIKNTKDVDLEAEIHRQKELSDAQNDNIEIGKIIAARLQNNEDIRLNIISRSKSTKEVEEKLRWVKTLADTANGKLSGKDKIMLETYIQTTYFDRIINRANLRLVTMSGGQYELIRQKEAGNAKSQSGLDLGVIDHYNGSERSVKTLSGGESFLTSLSLALGLSDEVQSQAGGIQIDTMFVDEGFGSLDPETLDMAYKALAGLTEGNRLVGIISHVADLKERIDKQIVVTKEKSGGSFIRMNV